MAHKMEQRVDGYNAAPNPNMREIVKGGQVCAYNWDSLLVSQTIPGPAAESGLGVAEATAPKSMRPIPASENVGDCCKDGHAVRFQGHPPGGAGERCFRNSVPDGLLEKRKTVHIQRLKHPSHVRRNHDKTQAQMRGRSHDLLRRMRWTAVPQENHMQLGPQGIQALPQEAENGHKGHLIDPGRLSPPHKMTAALAEMLLDGAVC